MFWRPFRFLLFPMLISLQNSGESLTIKQMLKGGLAVRDSLVVLLIFYYLPHHLETKVMQAINHLSLGCKIFPSPCFCTEGVVLCESQLYARVSTPTSYLFWLQGPYLQCARSSLESKFQVRGGFSDAPSQMQVVPLTQYAPREANLRQLMANMSQERRS